jgi:hypothetical protein
MAERAKNGSAAFFVSSEQGEQSRRLWDSMPRSQSVHGGGAQHLSSIPVILVRDSTGPERWFDCLAAA